MFFEGLRSERELMSVAADRLSVRWYLGYDLHEPLPDHSNLTRTRERFGLGVFRLFFERIVEECVEAGLVGGTSCSSTRPRSRATRPWTRWPRGGPWKRTWENSSTRGKRVTTRASIRRSACRRP